jgi:dTDP-4-dehydrorhamnose 3,5-epimerase
VSFLVPKWYFNEQPLKGVYLITPQRFCDARGATQRTFDSGELRFQGLDPYVDHCLISDNAQTGTVRGMHWQEEPFGQTKLISVLRGAIHDVLVDLRPKSRTFMQSCALRLMDGSGFLLWVPKGVAHGYQTLCDETVVHYAISTPQADGHARRARWDDPAFGIRWPLPCACISDSDRDAPLWRRAA